MRSDEAFWAGWRRLLPAKEERRADCVLSGRERERTMKLDSVGSAHALSCALRASARRDAFCCRNTPCSVSSDSAPVLPRTLILRNEPDWKSTVFMWNNLNVNGLGCECGKFQSGSFGMELRVRDATVRPQAGMPVPGAQGFHANAEACRHFDCAQCRLRAMATTGWIRGFG